MVWTNGKFYTYMGVMISKNKDGKQLSWQQLCRKEPWDYRFCMRNEKFCLYIRKSWVWSDRGQELGGWMRPAEVPSRLCYFVTKLCYFMCGMSWYVCYDYIVSDEKVILYCKETHPMHHFEMIKWEYHL